MKLKSSALGFFFVLAVIATAFIAVTHFANKPFLFAKVSVKIDPELKQAARGKHQLFLVVFDQNSKLPMPYGALRSEINNLEAKQEFFLSEHNLTVMNPAAPKPQKLRIKARLEKNGQAGPDKPGDLTGETLINTGSETTITINKLIQ